VIGTIFFGRKVLEEWRYMTRVSNCCSTWQRYCQFSTDKSLKYYTYPDRGQTLPTGGRTSEKQLGMKSKYHLQLEEELQKSNWA
jgi:hypothetical protein